MEDINSLLRLHHKYNHLEVRGEEKKYEPLDDSTSDVLREFIYLKMTKTSDIPTPLHWILKYCNRRVAEALLTQLLEIQKKNSALQPLLDTIANLIDSGGNTLFHIAFYRGRENPNLLRKLLQLTSYDIQSQALLIKEKEFEWPGLHMAIKFLPPVLLRELISGVNHAKLGEASVAQDKSKKTGIFMAIYFDVSSDVFQTLITVPDPAELNNILMMRPLAIEVIPNDNPYYRRLSYSPSMAPFETILEKRRFADIIKLLKIASPFIISTEWDRQLNFLRDDKEGSGRATVRAYASLMPLIKQSRIFLASSRTDDRSIAITNQSRNNPPPDSEYKYDYDSFNPLVETIKENVLLSAAEKRAVITLLTNQHSFIYDPKKSIQGKRWAFINFIKSYFEREKWCDADQWIHLIENHFLKETSLLKKNNASKENQENKNILATLLAARCLEHYHQNNGIANNNYDKFIDRFYQDFPLNSTPKYCNPEHNFLIAEALGCLPERPTKLASLFKTQIEVRILWHAHESARKGYSDAIKFLNIFTISQQPINLEEIEKYTYRHRVNYHTTLVRMLEKLIDQYESDETLQSTLKAHYNKKDFAAVEVSADYSTDICSTIYKLLLGKY